METMENLDEPKNAAVSDDEVGAELCRALVGVGAAWARYGLSVARTSLEATATLLGTLSDRIETLERRDPEDPAAV